MPIRPVDDPAPARALAERVLAARQPGPAGAGRVRAFAASQIGAVQIFNLSLESLLDQDLGSAVSTGWRYVSLRPGAKTGEIVEIRSDQAAEADLANYAVGMLAGRMSEAGNIAAEKLDGAPDDYEARILRLPEIHMEALWMHAPQEDVRDHFFGLPSTQRDLVDESFIEAAVNRARDYLARLSPRERDGEGGGGATA